MSEDQFSQIQGTLGSIGLSASIIIIGSILNKTLGFGARIVMTRFLPVNGYGEIVLGITVLNILAILSLLGLEKAQVRYLSRAENQNERTEIAAAIYQIGIILAVFWALVGFIFSNLIAETVFNSPGMANVVRVFSLSLPFYVFYKLSMKGIQGHKETTPHILTSKFVHPLVRLGGVTVIAFAGFGVVGLSIGFNFAFVIAGLVGFYFFMRGGEYRIRSLLTPVSGRQYRELLQFSVPLAVSASFGLVTSNTDRFLLGVIDTSMAVGIYDITLLVAKFILFFGPVFNYLFQPIMAEYDAEREIQKMEQLYTIITRWMVFLTFPIFTLLVLFPEPLLGTFFGNEYRAGGLALSILGIGYYLSQFVGLSGSFLVATGDSKIMMYISAATAALNAGLNISLIPIYGIVGAGLATSVSVVLNNVFQSAYVYKNIGIHPFRRELFVPLALSLASLFIMGAILPNSALNLFEIIVTTGALSCILLICIILTRSIYAIELKLADSVLNQIGIHLDLQNRLRLLTTD